MPLPLEPSNAVVLELAPKLSLYETPGRRGMLRRCSKHKVEGSLSMDTGASRLCILTLDTSELTFLPSVPPTPHPCRRCPSKQATVRSQSEAPDEELPANRRECWPAPFVPPPPSTASSPSPSNTHQLAAELVFHTSIIMPPNQCA